MTDKKIPKDDMEKDILGDKSAYGEFVSTFHHWTGLEGTHKRAEELYNATKNPSLRVPVKDKSNKNK